MTNLTYPAPIPHGCVARPVPAVDYPPGPHAVYVVQSLPAGFPSPAADYTADPLDLNRFLIDRVACTFIFDVGGYPPQRDGVAPSEDLPSDISRDFEEARAILNRSPRGAAALLRLCVQKLCAVLGEKGNNIDEDIASLVKKGLNPLVQKSLDVVRVIGNEAVHPGSMDIRDDRTTALQLLRIVNLIVEQMITLPKSITELYQTLPEGKLSAIDKRNEKALK